MKLLDIITMLVLGSANLVVAFPSTSSCSNKNNAKIWQNESCDSHIHRMTENSNTEQTESRRDILQKSIGAFMIMAGATSVTPSVSNAGSYDMLGKVKLGGLPNKIRKVGSIMDELQRDLMQERWDLVEKYPAQFRSYVPLFTTYTDAAFPTEAPSDYGLRVALRYEVGRFFAALERLKQATNRRALNEAYVAYSDMSLHYDRYLHVGGLYTYYDATITLEPLYKDTPRSALKYSDPEKNPAEVRDLVILAKGPDMGKTGILIGIYGDDTGNCVVKLDKYKGLREIKVVNRSWVAKREGEQDPDEVFLIKRKE